MEYKDYYKILGIERSASPDEIKKAFRKQAMKYHPDRNPGSKAAEDKFKDLNEANEVLSDPQKKARYDQLGESYFHYQQGGGPPGGFNWNDWTAARTGTGGARPGAENFNDIFGEMGGFSDFFTSIFGPNPGARAGRQAYRTPPRSEPVEQPVQISFDEAYHGAERTMLIGERRIEVKIPAGARSGTKVRITGVGQPGLDGRQGDIYLVVEVLPDERFERKDNDLLTEFEVDLFTAVLGGEAHVTTPDGQVVLNIPAGTQPGRAFRLAGRGMPHLRGPHNHGDLIAKAKVLLPRQLSAEQRTLFEKLAKMK